MRIIPWIGVALLGCSGATAPLAPVEARRAPGTSEPMASSDEARTAGEARAAPARPPSLPLCVGEPLVSTRTITMACCYVPSDVVVARVSAVRPQLAACYDAARHRDPAAQGRVTTRFSVGDDGRVDQACVEQAAFGDRAFARCVAEAYAEVTFPSTPPDSGCPAVTILYPLEFSPR